MELRDYQERAVLDFLGDPESKPCLVAPTGSGKTVVGTEIVRRSGRCTLWIAHRHELIHQARERLPGAGLILAGHPKTDAQIQVASIQTLVRREKPPADLIVVDEAHHARAETYTRVLDAYPDAWKLGLTATPFRLDGRGLGAIFGRLIVAAYPRALCDIGTLVKPRIFSFPAPSTKSVHVRSGDFVDGELAELFDKPEICLRIFEQWEKNAAGNRTVIYAINVEHSTHLRDLFVAHGVAAEHIDASTPQDERAAILARLRDGTTTVVCNCMILTEGWDLPALGVCLMARPTMSLNLYLQMAGRIMRSAEGKTSALILDCAGNYDRHGSPIAQLVYTLDDKKKVKKSDEEVKPETKKCPECFAIVDINARVCPECGHEFRGDREIDEVDVDLVERTDEEPRKPTRWIIGADGRTVRADLATFRDRCAVYARYRNRGEAMGYKRGWSSYRFKASFDAWPGREEGEWLRAKELSSTISSGPWSAGPTSASGGRTQE